MEELKDEIVATSGKEKNGELSNKNLEKIEAIWNQNSDSKIKKKLLAPKEKSNILSKHSFSSEKVEDFPSNIERSWEKFRKKKR